MSVTLSLDTEDQKLDLVATSRRFYDLVPFMRLADQYALPATLFTDDDGGDKHVFISLYDASDPQKVTELLLAAQIIADGGQWEITANAMTNNAAEAARQAASG